MNATVTQTPAQIDAQLADIWEKQAKVTRQAQQEQASLERVVKSGREYLYGRTAADIKAQIAKLSETMDELNAQAAPLNAEYADRRWSRFFPNSCKISDGARHGDFLIPTGPQRSHGRLWLCQSRCRLCDWRDAGSGHVVRSAAAGDP